MYENTEEALKEIHRRGREIRKKRDRRVKAVLSAAGSVAVFALLIVMSVFMDGVAAGAESSYGAFLLPAEAGGYVLIAVIAFLAGVAVTVLIRKMRDRDKNTED
jgi:putative copper export protein